MGDGGSGRGGTCGVGGSAGDASSSGPFGGSPAPVPGTIEAENFDNGADAFLGTGVHVVRGIEIYKGRPIFYGLGEFVRQMDVVGLAGLGRGRGTTDSPPVKYESIIALALQLFDRRRIAQMQVLGRHDQQVA